LKTLGTWIVGLAALAFVISAAGNVVGVETGPVGDAAAGSSPSPEPTPAVEQDDGGAGQSTGRKQKRRNEPRTTQSVATAPKTTATRGPRPRTYLVTHVVDGDTLDLANGETVRLVGIDTPERGQCGHEAATAQLARLVEGKRVRLTISDEDRDGYDRLLRYVNIGTMDAGLRQIKSGWAIARYDSRDGYGYHSRENVYIATDKATPDRRCPQPLALAPAPAAKGNCAVGYEPCVPPYPPDVDCADVDGPVSVTGSDPHGLDADGDGVACE
jgi:endonuclease YncB( thermonuclease family)